MTNFCKDCDIQDHESNLVYQQAGGWRCKFCNANPKRENYFACLCGEWKESDVKQLYNKQNKDSCPECGVYLNPLPIIDGSPAIDHDNKERGTMRFTVRQVGSDRTTQKFLDRLCVEEQISDDTFRAGYYILNSLCGHLYDEHRLCAAFGWAEIKARMVLRDCARLGIINIVEY